MWFRTPALSSIVTRTTAFAGNTFRRYPLSTQTLTVTSQARRVAELARELRTKSKGDDTLAAIASANRGSDSVTAFARNLAKSEADSLSLQTIDASSFQDILSFIPPQDDRRPPWLALYVLYHKARSSQDAVSSLDLIRRALPHVHSSTTDSIIVLTVAELAHKRLTAIIREFVQRFCEARHRPSKLHFNLLLRALSLHPRSKETSALVSQVLERMTQHGTKVRKQTYNALLSPGFVTMEVAVAVERKMVQDGVGPTRYQLQCLCDLMITHRYRKKAARYLRELRSKWKEEDAPRTVGVKLLQARYIKAFRRASLALRYLTRLVSSQNRQAHGSRIGRRLAVDIHQWVSTLYVASRAPETSAANLLKTFRQSASAYPLNRAAYSTVIKGLLAKHDYGNAVLLWDEASSYGLSLNTQSLGMGLCALTMNGQPNRAFQLLEAVHAAQDSGGSFAGRRPPAVTLRALHQFMVSLHRMGRPDVVFTLFDHIETLYHLRPDVYTINIMLHTARWARKFEDTIRGQLASIGIGRLSNPSSSEAEPSEDLRTQPACRITAMLDPERRPWVTGRWNFERAGQVALRHAVQMLLGNWPALASIPSPVQALRRGSDDAALNPVNEVINRVTERALYDESPLLSLLPDKPGTLYPEVVPTDVTFRALIELLATQSLQTEIPLVLAWMRVLRIQPSKATLATALVHWVDVSMDSPFIERMKGKQRRDPYSLLMQWMEDWVGAQHMPKREMSKEMRRAAYYRDVRYVDIINDRNRAAAAGRISRID